MPITTPYIEEEAGQRRRAAIEAEDLALVYQRPFPNALLLGSSDFVRAVIPRVLPHLGAPFAES